MPRRAPDKVQEHRITFGNYERQFVTEVKTDVEKTVKYTALSALAVPVSIGVAGALLGLGLYKGGQMIGKGLNEFQLLDWTPTPIIEEVKDAWTGVKWGIDPREDADSSTTPTLEEIAFATKDYSWFQKQELWLYVVSGGTLGKSHDDLRAENAPYESRKDSITPTTRT